MLIRYLKEDCFNNKVFFQLSISYQFLMIGLTDLYFDTIQMKTLFSTAIHKIEKQNQMDNSMAEPNVQLSNIDENIQLITQQSEMQDISSQNENTDESRQASYNTSVKSLKGTKLLLDIEEYEKLLISSSEFIIT